MQMYVELRKISENAIYESEVSNQADHYIFDQRGGRRIENESGG